MGDEILFIIIILIVSLSVIFILSRFDFLDLKIFNFKKFDKEYKVDYNCLRGLGQGKISNDLIINGTIDRYDNRISGSYTKFEGIQVYSIAFNTNTLNLIIESTSINGEIIIRLRDLSSSQVILEWKNPSNINHNLLLDENISYGVEIVGKNHKGNLDIFWGN